MRMPMLSARATSASMCYLRQWGAETRLALDRQAGETGEVRGHAVGNSPATLRYDADSVKIVGFRPAATVPRGPNERKVLPMLELPRSSRPWWWVALAALAWLPEVAGAQTA